MFFNSFLFPFFINHVIVTILTCKSIFRFPLFGKKYQLKFTNDIASETHCLVHFPSLIRLKFHLVLEFDFLRSFSIKKNVKMILTQRNVRIRLAREVGLEYVEIQNLTEFYDDNRYLLS